MTRAAAAAALALAIGGCTPSSSSAPPAPSAHVGGDVVAVVDGRPIRADEVRRELARGGASPRAVLNALEDEALLVAEAERTGARATVAPEQLEKRALVQRLLRDVERDTRVEGATETDDALVAGRFAGVRALVDDAARTNAVEVREATARRVLADDALFERIAR